MISRRVVPPLRRTVQALSLALVAVVPLLALYSHYKAARAIDDLPRDEWRGAAVHAIDRAVGENARRREAVDSTQGTLWSMRVFGVSLTDPLAGAEAMLSSRSFYWPLAVSLAIPLAVSVLLGRVFCGWICPMNTLLELVDRGRRLLRLAEIRERDVRFSLKGKYLVLIISLGVVAATGAPFLALIYPPALLSREWHALVFGAGVGIGVYLVLAIAAIELFVSRRWWCRYVCPGGALYSLLGRFRVVRVRRDVKKCVECGDCIRACQFDLRPMLVETTGTECTNCAACIANCDSEALAYRLVSPLPVLRRKDENSGGGNEKHTGDDAKSRRRSAGTIVAGVLLAWLVTPAVAQAHHILGLPHYSYKENYPQVPTLEYPATTGPYDVLMTSYPGKPVPGEAGTIAFYIKDRTSGRPYDKPVTVSVLKTATFGANTTVYEPTEHAPFDNEHKYTITFPDDGEYIVRLEMMVENRTEVIPFLIVAGNPTATASIVVALVAGLTIFLVVVRAVKVKRKRRARRAGPSPNAAHRQPSPM